MSREAEPAVSAVGFRVKSGWATAVLLVGPARAPRVADRRVIDLSDPAVPGSRQPYHAVMAASEEDGPKLETELRRVVENITTRSISNLLEGYRHAGQEVGGVGLVVGSDIDPAGIKNDHIRAHALEGRLFRTALEGAVRSFGLPCSVVVEREAYAKAAAVLKRSEGELKRAVADLGRAQGGPWRADEKTAALAAWMALE